MLVSLFVPALLGLGQGITPPVVWYGPATASFHDVFDGDPFDPAQNDLHVKFTGERGEVYDRIAFFDGNGYSAILVAPTKGKFKAELTRNGKHVEAAADEGTVMLSDALPNGFIHLDPEHVNRLRWDSGHPYYPIGIDLAWKADVPLVDQIAKVGAAGGNWARIWACAWDGKNPWWPQNDPKAVKGQMWLPALQQWARIEQACDKATLPFQLTLFHHGEVSSTTDSNWKENPWNAANGGFLKDPTEFFTDAEAKRRTKIWLRYAVARYGGSPNLLSWELFNEVQWVDAMKMHEPEVAAWHKEMADYLRSIDPYHHLVTSSSVLDFADLNAPVDYLQPHTYPVDIMGSILGTPLPAGKPAFYGEFGPGTKQDPRAAMRDGIYAGMLANQAGAGQYWYWDLVEKNNLYSELRTAQDVAAVSQIALHPDAHGSRLSASAPGGADLVMRPGGGWQKAGKLTFDLPEQGTLKDLGGLPMYFQGNNHRDMFPQPLELRFHLSKIGSLRLGVGTVAQAGATIVITDGSTEIARHEYPAGDKNKELNETVSVELQPGDHDIKIANTGSDWFTLGSITVPNIGPAVRVTALEDVTWLFARMTLADGVSGPAPVTLSGVALQDGSYSATLIDLDTAKEVQQTVTVKGFQVSPLTLSTRDCVLVLKR